MGLYDEKGEVVIEYCGISALLTRHSEALIQIITNISKEIVIHINT